jgi:hypothetical protein
MLTSFLARGDHLRASPCQHLPAYSDVLRRFGRLIVGFADRGTPKETLLRVSTGGPFRQWEVRRSRTGI